MYDQLKINRQYGLPDSFRVPTEQDIKKAVQEVLEEILPSAPAPLSNPAVTITKTGKQRKPRTGKETPNLFHAEFRHIHSYDNMPSTVEDIFMGAVRQTTTGSNLNPYVVFNLLKSLNTVSTESVYMAVNCRRPKAEHIDVRYAQLLACACRNVISAFEHHSEVKNITSYYIEGTLYDDFDIESDAEGYRNHIQPVQTPEQKRELLVQAGLTPSQVETHMNGEKVVWGFSIRSRAGISIQLVSDYPLEHSDPDNVGSLQWLPELQCYVDSNTGEMFGW
ncbi:hypothetical protein EIC82_22580 [Enterobacter sp. A11]|uniref:hypothetical protein n=1 Tax=unclassified Enterobacter TaxID=2608935 RepID=UPI00106FF807|nr:MULTISPECIES: hypothetical protein [unclassified Enterobacter]MBM1024058.1 hypothetical protein [Enterobacter sp. E1]MEA3565676.1 hypothetical protein [Enterobacter sp. GM-22]MEA3599057.1 hypothetical protein [Enterobacter sp. GM-31]TFF54012.1 hypothetical protein EIC82_22580 [Enterobacter sp. A11]